MEHAPHPRLSPWPHRLAVALALVTFPLIWVGGLVTTYDAGMAVPDWPGTYGYNLLLYPWQSWVAAPWDLFIEHGHRLLGATAGLLALALVAVVLLGDRRPWLIAASLGALALVIFQGMLGGARVLFDARVVALLHGCVGPLFFAYLAALVVATGRLRGKGVALQTAEMQRLSIAAWVVAGLAFVQLALGAVVRHVPLAASPQLFRAALFLHLIVAGLLSLQIAWSAYLGAGLWKVAQPLGLIGPNLGLCLLVAAQVALGVATYVVKYSWPAWASEFSLTAGYVVEEKSWMQSLITTAHVANGSLILFVGTLLAMRASGTFFLVSEIRTGWQPVLRGGLVA